VAQITAALVKQLRDRTGVGMMDSKRALEATGGDLEKAVDYLRQHGQAKAEKKAGRAANEGVIEAYVHNSGVGAKLGVLVELNCESDFVAKTDEFKKLARELALQVAGRAPQYVRREEIPADILEREKSVYRAQVADKPANIQEKILEGKLEAFFSEVCLLDQPYVRDEKGKKKVDELIKEAIAKLGENITVARFCRLVVGEAAEGNGAAPPAES
jgi:elongation factor Ts